MWIQREPPSSRDTRKRKRAPNKTTVEYRKKRVAVDTGKGRDAEENRLSRNRVTRIASQRVTGQTSNPSHTSSRQSSATTTTTTTTSGPRAAKLQANMKLGEQAKQLAALQKQTSLEAKGRHLASTRLSSRLRGGTEDDEWQQIPSDWLDKQDNDSDSSMHRSEGRTTRRSARLTVKASEERVGVSKHVKATIGLDSEDESDLTELSEDEQDSASSSDDALVDELAGAAVKSEPWEPSAENISLALPENFVEWETVLVHIPV